jgi:very-short-patch-repair endonuclease
MARGEVLVVIMNNERDWQAVQEQGWYRIPVSSVEKWLKDRWPPAWLAFYQTKEFGPEAHAIHYYAPVLGIQRATRLELLPDTPRNHPKAQRRYYKILLGPLQKLGTPIFSRRYRRLVFIPTTLKKFHNALEINDLWDESPLEDKLWALFKRTKIRAERQYVVEVDSDTYFLDFAIFCNKGKIDVEVDSDTYHSPYDQVVADKERNNQVASKGWEVLRFTSKHINESPIKYCVSQVMKTVKQLGGFDDTIGVPAPFDPDDPLGPQQLSLFD